MNYMETDIANDAGKELDRNPGILLVELRPNLNKPGYNFQNEWINQKKNRTRWSNHS